MTFRFNENNRTTTTEADKLLGTTADGKLPACDGSQLTNINLTGSNSRSLVFGGNIGASVTHNLVRNTFNFIAGSVSTLRITSALRTSYVNGDLIVILNPINAFYTITNIDTAAGTKLFVKGVETTSWRVQQERSTIKLRLTTHTDGALYVHACEDLSILDDLSDVIDTHSSVPIGASLKYNPYQGKWKAKQNWMPKSLVINNTNAINYLSNYTPTTIGGSDNYWDVLEIDLAATQVANVPNDPDMSLHPTISGWSDFFDDDTFYDYDHFVIVFQITPNTPITLYSQITSTTYNTTSRTFAMKDIQNDSVFIRIHLPAHDAKWIGKKITFICDGINTNADANLNGRRIAYRVLREKGAVTGSSAYIDYGNGIGNAVSSSTSVGPEVCNSTGNYIGDRGAITLMLTDDTYYPLKPGSTGETTFANAKMWVQVPF